jgi:hypothetical protein
MEAQPGVKFRYGLDIADDSENRYIYGLHDAGGEQLLAGKGWVVVTEGIGRDPNNQNGASYLPIASQGLGVISRLNNGYGSTGTIPRPEYYQNFAVRCGNFAQASQGCHIWIIGNEPNHHQEWPDGQAIYPGDYARCYRLCRADIRRRPGHQNDIVLLAGPGPWNASVTYATNLTGDWVQYLQDQVRGAQSGETTVDGVALHTYTHGHDPALIRSIATMSPPFQNRYYNFWSYKDFLDGLKALDYLNKPIFITESNGNDKNWSGGNNGWVQAAYADINAWNIQNPRQVVYCLALFRWKQDPEGYSIENNQAVQQDMRQAVQQGYTWNDKVITPEPPPGKNPLPLARETATHLQAATDSNQRTIDALTGDDTDLALAHAVQTARHLQDASESNHEVIRLLTESDQSVAALESARQTAQRLLAATESNDQTIVILQEPNAPVA